MPFTAVQATGTQFHLHHTAVGSMRYFAPFAPTFSAHGLNPAVCDPFQLCAEDIKYKEDDILKRKCLIYISNEMLIARINVIYFM
jgi:hypothetical protein